MKRTRVKICGITRVEDAIAAVECGADALGFNFVSASPRCISIEQASAIVRHLPAFVSRVAVLMDAPAGFVKELIDEINPDLLQFHGTETPAQCSAFNRAYLRAWRLSIPAGSAEHERSWRANLLESTAAFRQEALCRGLLFDAPATKGFVGHGSRFDWSQLPTELASDGIIAGGLNASNVGELIINARPFAVDVSSGVESAPGIKDHDMLQQFFAAVRRADATTTAPAQS